MVLIVPGLPAGPDPIPNLDLTPFNSIHKAVYPFHHETIIENDSVLSLYMNKKQFALQNLLIDRIPHPLEQPRVILEQWLSVLHSSDWLFWRCN